MRESAASRWTPSGARLCKAYTNSNMGILDEAIKEHLDLKRRRGTDEPELKRLEDEAFGPPGRPDASGADAAIASALAAPPAGPTITELPSESPPGDSESAADAPPAEAAAPDAPAPEAPVAPDRAPEDEPSPSQESQGGSMFHDFAAEEGLVEADVRDSAVADEPVSAGEKAVSDALSGGSSAPAPSEQEAAPEADEESPDASDEEPAPGQDDTQVHDMAKELGLDDNGESGSGSAAAEAPPDDAETSPDRIELDDADLELESEEIELDVGDIEISEPKTGGGEDDAEADNDEPEDGEDGEDVLEETPEFLRDAPESDRLWFEQGKPKDFDFDDEDADR
jgi:hypothetical protein